MLQTCRTPMRDCGIGCSLRENSRGGEKKSPHCESHPLKGTARQRSSCTGQEFAFLVFRHDLVTATLRLKVCVAKSIQLNWTWNPLRLWYARPLAAFFRLASFVPGSACRHKSLCGRLVPGKHSGLRHERLRGVHTSTIPAKVPPRAGQVCPAPRPSWAPRFPVSSRSRLASPLDLPKYTTRFLQGAPTWRRTARWRFVGLSLCEPRFSMQRAALSKYALRCAEPHHTLIPRELRAG